MPELTREELIEVIKRHRPYSLASLQKSLKGENINVSDEKLLWLVKQLQSDGTIELSTKDAASFRGYLIDIWNAWWFYLVIIVALSELFLVISNAQAGAALFLRILFGLGILGIIPGSLTVMIVFPGGQVNALEKIVLSIFLSVLISITVGVLLGLGPFFQASNNIIIITVYVVLADVAASYRSYDFLRSAHKFA
ncbi:hypothetical protein E6H20_01930 [Candidatus Bathyarchaeota archaeon]|nr:MAG: hypothetical protein E6H20_01930 [Candidatus Bathyarchaeota archaeon]